MEQMLRMEQLGDWLVVEKLFRQPGDSLAEIIISPTTAVRFANHKLEHSERFVFLFKTAALFPRNAGKDESAPRASFRMDMGNIGDMDHGAADVVILVTVVEAVKCVPTPVGGPEGHICAHAMALILAIN
ncbi:unnamed protein product, partial [Porites evermanni]